LKKLEIPRAREGVNLKKPEPRARKARFETQKRPRPKPRAQYTLSIRKNAIEGAVHAKTTFDILK